MANITKSNYRVWYQNENIIEDILNELECSETSHFTYWIRGTRYDYIIRAFGSAGKAISLSTLKHGLDELSELEGCYLQNDTIEQKRIKSLRYILAKAYYRLCCELIQIRCYKKDQHSKASAFATRNGEDIYQHLLNVKAERIRKREHRIRQKGKRKRKIVVVTRFDLMDFDD